MCENLQIQWVHERVRNDSSCSASNGVTPWREYLDFGLSSHSEDIAGAQSERWWTAGDANQGVYMDYDGFLYITISTRQKTSHRCYWHHKLGVAAPQSRGIFRMMLTDMPRFRIRDAT
jgi:hypothetical protein